MIGIYKITSPSGKVYIGQSWNIERRFRQYKGLNCKSQSSLYNSLIKYGYDDHEFKIIFEMPETTTKLHIDYVEVFYWRLEILAGSNMINLALPGSRGKASELTKSKQSSSMKGKKHSQFTKDTISYIRTIRPNLGGRKNKGIVRTEENKKKISDSLKARIDNKGQLHNMAKLTEEQVLEIRSKYIPRKYSTLKLAKEYNVSKTNIKDIINRKIWKHI